MLPSLILALFPRSVLVWHLGWMNRKAEALYEKQHKTERLLDAIDGGYEYTFGYRNHLRRKSLELRDKLEVLLEKIDYLERVLYPEPK